MIASKYSSIPIFSWLCLKSGYIFVDRNDPNSRQMSIPNAIKTINDGSSFVIYPEGQREIIPYKLEKFKTGAFRIAQQLNIPIQPIIIKGTSNALKSNNLCYPSNIEIIIEEPFYVNSSENPKLNWLYVLNSVEKSKNLILKYY